MAFNVDMSPLERASIGSANTLTGIGSMLGNKIQESSAQDKQAQFNQAVNAALGGDEQALEMVGMQNPELAMKIRDRKAAQDAELNSVLSSEMANKTADVWSIMLNSPQEQQEALFNQYVDDPTLDIDEEDRGLLSKPNVVKGLIGKIKGKDYMEQVFGGSVDSVENPASVKETEWFLKQSKDVQDQHIKLKRKSDPTMAEQLEQKQKESDIKVTEESRKTTEKSKAARTQGYIDSGIEAADSLGNINRAIELLGAVETGGFDNVALRAKQIFGIESADEAELSASLGKAILSQLKPIFGAAFTAAEGERLERIEANFGKSTEGNKRLLQEVKRITDRAARRGLKAAIETGDKFTESEIRSILNTEKETINEVSAKSGTPAQLSDEELLKKYGGE